MSWAAEEFKGIDLGDKRLGKRVVLLAERLAEKPTASIPGACGGWAETQGAYRFFAHDEMDWRDILEPHWQCSVARMREHEIVARAFKTPRGSISTDRTSPAWGR